MTDQKLEASSSNISWRKALGGGACRVCGLVALDIARSKSVANPWQDPKIAVLAGQKVVKSRIRPLRGSEA